MRLLGKCPNCGTEDSISKIGILCKIACEVCGAKWEDWIELKSEEIKKGNVLIPVEVSIQPGHVKVWFVEPRYLPATRFITSTLNTALMMRFKLQVLCFVAEGGLHGSIKGRHIELTNIDDSIGLLREFDNPVCEEILKWYGGALKLLFEEELKFEGKNYGRGAILRLDPKEPDYAKKVKFFLWLALYKKARSTRFADDVFKRLDFELSQPVGANYISGLTDEQIVEFFVQPPITK